MPRAGFTGTGASASLNSKDDLASGHAQSYSIPSGEGETAGRGVGFTGSALSHGAPEEKMRIGRLRSLCLLCAPLAIGDRALALDFVFDHPSNVPAPVVAAFQAAADRWSANLTTPITVSIFYDWSDLGSNTLGGSTPFYNVANPTFYAVFRNALLAHDTSADDLAAHSHLSMDRSFNVLLNHTLDQPGNTPFLDNNGDTNNTRILATQANLQALGMGLANASGAGSIVLNSSIAWAYTPRAVAAGKVDLVGIATHEIGHILGFGSGVDFLDQNPDQYTDDQLTRVSPVDLFRFSTQSAALGAIDFTADTRDKYFSIDGGATKIASFSTGQALGDGYQAGHWKDQNPSIGLMDPTGNYGELLQMTELDRRAFDVIGYTRNMSWSWNYAPGGRWADALNWNADGVPTSAIDAVFNLNASSPTAAYTVNFDAPAVAHSIRVTSDDVTFNLGGKTITASADLVVGDLTGSTGRLTLTGPGSISAQSLHVGGSSAGAGGTGQVTISTGAAVTIAGAVTVWNTPGSALNLNGGSLSANSIVNGGTFNHASGTLAIATTFTNAGTANFGLGQSWGSGSSLIANAGSATFNAPSGTIANRPLGITVNAGANVKFNSPQYLDSLTVNDGGAVQLAGGRSNLLVLNSLNLTGTGMLDLVDNDLILTYSQTSPLQQIQQYAADGLQGVHGLVASAAGDTSFSKTRRALAVFDNIYAKFSTFDGVSLGTGSGDFRQVIVKYTYLGDSNLDGRVDPTDYAAVDGNMGKGTSWPAGDLNFDGKVDPTDYAQVDGNQGAGYGGDHGGPPLASRLGGPPMQYALIVPEPSSLALIGAGIGLLLVHRSRRCAKP
jgi:hypothetical protein